jgi:redox-sensitive bicupin YhaK (pirin superfamily)
MTIRTFKGENAPIEMDAEGIAIKEVRLQQGKQELQIPSGKILSVFVIEGSVQVENEKLKAEDFFTVQDGDVIQLNAEENCWLFIIESPVKPSYATYASTM